MSQTFEMRLARIEEMLSSMVALLKSRPTGAMMTLKEAAAYTGYSTHYLRRLAVDRKLIPYQQPGGVKGKLGFMQADLDCFMRAPMSGRPPPLLKNMPRKKYHPRGGRVLLDH